MNYVNKRVESRESIYLFFQLNLGRDFYTWAYDLVMY